MIHALSVIVSFVCTGLVFLQLANLNTDRVQIQPKITYPTKFYKLYKPKQNEQPKKRKSKQKQKHSKKKIDKQKKSLPKPKVNSLKQIQTKDAQREKETAIDMSDLDQEAIVIQKIIPKYPSVAQKAGIECKVLLEVIINEKGRVASAKVVFVSQKGYGFEKNALDAVKKIFFEPFIQKGRPVKAKVIYPIDFVLIE